MNNIRRCRKPLPGLRRLLQLFAELAAFTTEDDAALDLIPENSSTSGCRECAATATAARRCPGKVGEATACLIYAVRPEVCRTCMPGDVECAMARKRHGLPVLAVSLRAAARLRIAPRDLS